ncbi:MAG: hypothetical protein K2R98_34500 [Gemmataceae bacterium]|nr:hypothetical protein [Gemmataceae bacterium]
MLQLENEWWTARDPAPLLRWLHHAGWPGIRQAHLFACACCRRIWPRLTEELCRRAVEVSERYADGKADDRERTSVVAAFHPCGTLDPRFNLPASRASLAALYAEVPGNVERAASHAVRALKHQGRAAERAVQASLLRDIVARSPLPVLDSAWMAANNGLVLKLAHSIYEERAFDRLPILADALEDVGCADQGLLNHCRQAGEHARGCWAVDLLLQK